ncbi:adenylate isopentenyltransferase 3, chloroplastic isoform X1 [Cornus florida]|uniref:adenylate isopentenyltransferase 3, chloroplastic isoform X1 n=1 Tax=Cornus florida TaxID=4283 RepID=UPI00289AB089|nr:adenylate isopentenyltransferase 3, chloroplastic isoform X1 [Cornus florida]
MRISMLMRRPEPPLLNLPTGRINTQVLELWPPKDKVVVVMGATGTGKSRLSIDLATRFPSAEIVNSDKMQVYKGLDIVTNKITEEESRGIPHHLLGVIDPNADFSATNFCNMASHAVKSIVNTGQLPIIVGGSNSYMEALIEDETSEFRPRYECCFLWVDVSMPVLHSALSRRVDQMVEAGMVEEAREMFTPDADYSRGIRRAIGIPEFDPYFRAQRCYNGIRNDSLLQAAIQAIKNNTSQLAKRQLDKIHRLRNVRGWKVHRLDATDVFRKRGREADEAWEEMVAGPSSMIVSDFLMISAGLRSTPVPWLPPLEEPRQWGQPWQLQLTRKQQVVTSI